MATNTSQNRKHETTRKTNDIEQAPILTSKAEFDAAVAAAEKNRGGFTVEHVTRGGRALGVRVVLNGFDEADR